MKFNLLDVLNEYTESEKDHRRDSTEDPLENWTGVWMPHQPGEPTPPPKVFYQKHNDDTPHHGDRNPMGAQQKCDDGKVEFKSITFALVCKSSMDLISFSSNFRLI